MRTANEIAVITGASSGIGREIALVLDHMGFSTVLVSRREERLRSVSERMKNPCRIIAADLADVEECRRVYALAKGDDVSILVNCAGFGSVGYFEQSKLADDLRMIETNVTALHVLTKLFLRDFVRKDKGYILNVASSAGLMPGGPLMATYYASKAYVCSLTSSIAAELSERGSRVYVGALCPGPVDTEFNDVAGVRFATKGISSKTCAQYAVMNMFRRKTIIIPTALMKASCVAQRAVPKKAVLKIASKYQKKKLD